MATVSATPTPFPHRDRAEDGCRGGPNVCVVPSVKIEGTRAQQLQTLDTLIAHLEQLRRGLAGAAGRPSGGLEGPSPYASSPTWPWLVAGLVASALVAFAAVLFMNF